MSTPSDVSVSAHAGAISGLWRGSTITLSVVRASVAGILRTDSDPLTVGTDLVYSTIVTSLGVARTFGSHVAWGIAARMRNGQIEFDHRTAISVDAGVVVDHLTSLDARLGVSTFLASPWSRGAEHTTYLAGADVRLVQADSDRVIRAGVAAAMTQAGSSEQFVFVSARFRAWEVRGGSVRTAAYAADNLRTRLALGVHYEGYAVGLAREESPAGLGASYQFVLSTLLK